jgi:hypothetical protein
VEIGNLLEDIKTYFWHSLGVQFDTLETKRKQEEVDKSLAIFFSQVVGRFNPTLGIK